jgi:hypothetical protein
MIVRSPIFSRRDQSDYAYAIGLTPPLSRAGRAPRRPHSGASAAGSGRGGTGRSPGWGRKPRGAREGFVALRFGIIRREAARLGRRGELVHANAHRARPTIRGYTPEIADEYVETVTKQARFLRQVSFLF